MDKVNIVIYNALHLINKVPLKIVLSMVLIISIMTIIKKIITFIFVQDYYIIIFVQDN